MLDELLPILVSSGIAALAAVIVALLNNWEKINPNKRYIKEARKEIGELKSKVEDLQTSIGTAFDARRQGRDERKKLYEELKVMKSAQRTTLQTEILSKSKQIQSAIANGDIDYSEDLKQLIILYREYWLCNFNHQGQLYFNDTVAKAADHNNVLTHELMNVYFPEYQPEE